MFYYNSTSRTVVGIDQLSKKTQPRDIIVSNIKDIAMDTGLFGSLWDFSIDGARKYVSTHSQL